MKKIIYTSAVFFSLSILTACNNHPETNNESSSNSANNTDSTAGMFHKDSVDKAQDLNEDKNINDMDSKFMTEAASAGMMEVTLGKEAEEKTMSSEVKKFAKEMVKDHSKANEELKSLADKKQITISSSMSDSHKEILEKVNKKTGSDFDKEYADQMVKAHKDDVDLFDKTAQEGKSPEIREWANKMLPTLRHHLEMAEKLQKKLEAKS